MRPVPLIRLRSANEEVARLEEQVGRVLDHTREKVLSNGLTFADSFQGLVVTLDDFTVPSDWRPLPLAAGYSVRNAAGPPAYRWRAGYWELDGHVSHVAGVTPGASTVIGTLPGGHAGGNAEVGSAANNAFALLSLDGTGALAWVAAAASTASAGWLSLNGVRFRAKAMTPPEWLKQNQVRRILPRGMRVPTGHLVLGASAQDGSTMDAVSFDMVTEATGGEVALRIRRATGFAPGKTYTVSLFLMTE